LQAKPRACGISLKQGTEESNLALRFWRPSRAATAASDYGPASRRVTTVVTGFALRRTLS
jgi:hypothetical protein